MRSNEFLFVLLVVFLLYSNLQVEGCKPLPAAQIMAAGMNFMLGENVQSYEQEKYPVFVYEQQKPNIYVPVGRDDLEFCYSSDLVLYPHAHLEVNRSSDIFYSSHEMIHYSMQSFDLGISVVTKNYAIDAGYSNEYHHFRYHLDETTKVAALGTYYTATFKMVNPPYIVATLHPYLLKVIDLIPTNPRSKEDLVPIQILIDKWGHFYLDEGVFGGKMHYANYLERHLVVDKDVSWTKEQLTLSFRKATFNITAGIGEQIADIKVDNLFTESTNDQMYFTGGLRQYQRNGTLSEWSKSVDDFAELISAKYGLLSNLVLNDPIKKKNLEMILTNHINTKKIEVPTLMSNNHKMKIMSEEYSALEIPGWNLVGAGYDPTTRQIGSTIVQHTLDSSAKTWVNPVYKNISYAVPNTLYVWNTQESYDQSNIFMSYSYLNFTSEVESRTSESSLGGLSHHESYYYHYADHYFKQNKVAITQQRKIEWYRLGFAPQVHVAPHKYMSELIRKKIDQMPTDVKYQYMYDQLVDSLKPEVITEVRMGGGAWTSLFVDSTIIRYIDIYKWDSSNSFGIDHFFHIGSGDHDELRNSDIQILSNSSIVISYDGGYFNAIDYGMGTYKDIKIKPWDEYKLTLKENPAPLHIKSLPLHYFVQDPIKKQLVKDATHRYYLKKQQKKL